MWSDRYYYLNIYKDESLSAEVSTSELIDFISTIPELKKIGKFGFRNKEPFPYTDMILLKAKRLRSQSEHDANPKSTNLVAIICSKGNHINFKELERVFIKIASFLNWHLADERTDDEVENYVIWKPEKK